MGISASSFKTILICGDIAAILAAGAATWTALGGLTPSPWGLAVLGVSLVVGLYLVEAFEERVYREHEGLPTRIMIALTIAASGTGMTSFFWSPLRLSPSATSTVFLFLVPFLLIWRIGGAGIVRRALRPRRIAVVGSGDAAADLVEAFSESHAHQLVATVECVGGDLFVSRNDSGTQRIPVTVMSEFLDALRIDLLAVAAPEVHRASLFSELVRCRYQGTEVQDAATCFEMLRHRLPTKYLEDAWVAFSSRFEGWGHDFEEKLKRVQDLTFSIAILLATGPLMLLIALAIRLTSPGPAIYRQERVGRGGRSFVLLKFRSMRIDAEANGPMWALDSDPRATPLGKLLRRSHLDELPQLFNVLRGDMSLVGPRPERPQFVADLGECIPYYHLRHIVKPGVTGWAQICCPYGASVRDAEAKLEYDLYYLRHKSLLWDLRIILRTITVSFLGRGSR